MNISIVSHVRHLTRCATRSVCSTMAAIVLTYSPVCSADSLQPWHTENLTAEFTAEKSEQIVSFDDYRQLERKLFAQLAKTVYARVGTGPEYKLVRYSTGSAADPERNQPNWNRSFELTHDTPLGGVLLLHGMSDSPYSLRALSKTLNQQFYWVLGLRLPGHGTAPSALTRLSWEDMAAAVRMGMTHLALQLGDKPIHMVGYSTGAPLAVDYTLNTLTDSAQPIPASLVLISPAVGIHATAALAKWKRRLSALPGLQKLAWLQRLPEFDPYKYNSFATNAAEQVFRLTRSVSKRLAARARTKPTAVLPPTLVLKSTVDDTVSNDAVVERLLKFLQPNRHELVLFDINRLAAKSTLLINDPGRFTTQLMASAKLPFSVTLLTNETPTSTSVVVQHKASLSTEVKKVTRLNLAWPKGVISLSHVALPIPPDDPLYGRFPPIDTETLFLGPAAIQGERGLFKLPTHWLLRIRYNPFYTFLENRTLEWIKNATANSH